MADEDSPGEEVAWDPSGRPEVVNGENKGGDMLKVALEHNLIHSLLEFNVRGNSVG